MTLSESQKYEGDSLQLVYIHSDKQMLAMNYGLFAPDTDIGYLGNFVYKPSEIHTETDSTGEIVYPYISFMLYDNDEDGVNDLSSLKDGHTYCILKDTVYFEEANFSYSNINNLTGSLESIKLNAYDVGFTTNPETGYCDFTYYYDSENPFQAEYLPLSVIWKPYFAGRTGELHGEGCLQSYYDFSASFIINFKVYDMTEHGNPDSTDDDNYGTGYPENDSSSSGDSGGSGSVDLSPVVGEMQAQTDRVVGEIDSSTEIIQQEIQGQTGTITQEIQGQTDVIGGKLDEQTQELEEQTEIMEDQKETQKGILEKVTDFFGAFFENLIGSVIGLFVPSEEEMQSLLNEMMTFFSEKFGFLFYPFELLGQAVQIFTQDGTTALIFPSFSIMGHEVWPDLSYDITENEIANTVFTYVRYATGAMLAMAFINYLRNFFDKRFGGGGS